MASKKYNPDDIERWVTIKGARIPIMKDGTMGIGVKEDKALKRETSALKKAKDLSNSKDVIWGKDNSTNNKREKYTYEESQAMYYAFENRFKTKEDALDAYRKGNMSSTEYYYKKSLNTPVKSDKIKTTSRNARYDTSRAKKNKPPIEDRFSFKVAMPHPNASNDSQMKATTKLAVSQITKQFEDSGIKLSKAGAFNGSQFFIPDKGSYVVELSRTSMGDSKNQVSFNTRIWDNSTATGKNLIKRFKK